MIKVFYDPKRDNKIIGMTDGDEPFDFPFVEADQEYHSMKGFKVVGKGKNAKFIPPGGTLKM